MPAIGIVTIVAAYLVGGIPIGLLMGRARGVDVREYGSGNIGASNVLRTLGPKVGGVVWVADIFKGFAPVAAAKYMPLSSEAWLAGVALAAVLGHCFSPYLKLSGGRGVSTSLGALLSLDWVVGLSACAVWLVLVAVTRYISLGSMVAAFSVPILFAVYDQAVVYIAFGASIWLLIWLRHMPNVRRLVGGTETKIGERGKKSSEEAGNDR